jgi:DeoR-like helix-turn-helix domain
MLGVRDTGEFESSGCAEVKTNKHKTLQLIRKLGTTHSKDLVRQFGYSPGTARSYLSHLGRQGLLERTSGGYGLTAKGMIRVRYFDVFGCAGIACPLCKGKAGFLSCPSCEHRISKKDAKISNERDFLLVLRHAGVYCDRCATLIVDEAQGQLLGIAREE